MGCHKCAVKARRRWVGVGKIRVNLWADAFAAEVGLEGNADDRQLRKNANRARASVKCVTSTRSAPQIELCDCAAREKWLTKMEWTRLCK